jgi:hypothetical protein
MSSLVVTSIWTLAKVSIVRTCLGRWKLSYCWVEAMVSGIIHRSLTFFESCEQGTQLQSKVEMPWRTVTNS